MLIWAIGTVMILVGVVDILLLHGITVFIDLFLFLGGWGIVIINEVIFGARKEQLEINRDETIKKRPSSPMVLAICPECKSRIPSESKYCPECGTDLTINA